MSCSHTEAIGGFCPDCERTTAIETIGKPIGTVSGKNISVPESDAAIAVLTKALNNGRSMLDAQDATIKGLQARLTECAEKALLDREDSRKRLAESEAANAAMREVLTDCSKALNNIGVQFAGPSSNEVNQRDINQIRAVYEKWNIEESRWRDALSGDAGRALVDEATRLRADVATLTEINAELRALAEKLRDSLLHPESSDARHLQALELADRVLGPVTK